MQIKINKEDVKCIIIITPKKDDDDGKILYFIINVFSNKLVSDKKYFTLLFFIHIL